MDGWMDGWSGNVRGSLRMTEKRRKRHTVAPVRTAYCAFSICIRPESAIKEKNRTRSAIFRLPLPIPRVLGIISIFPFICDASASVRVHLWFSTSWTVRVPVASRCFARSYKSRSHCTVDSVYAYHPYSCRPRPNGAGHQLLAVYVCACVCVRSILQIYKMRRALLSENCRQLNLFYNRMKMIRRHEKK